MGGEGDEEEEEKPGEGDKTTYNENPKYDPPPLRDLIDGSMSFWVHHSQYILPQGFRQDIIPFITQIMNASIWLGEFSRQFVRSQSLAARRA